MPKQHYHILLAFMRHINKPKNQIPDYGLCTHLERFIDEKQLKASLHVFVKAAMLNLFTQLGLHTKHPFNKNLDDYLDEAVMGAIFQNPRRLAFIATFLSGGYRHLITC